MKKAEIDSGKRVGVPAEVADKVKALEREVRELRQANERFFLAYAKASQAKSCEGVAGARVLTDPPRSPPYHRVNGIVRNVDARYTAFGVKPGDALYLVSGDRVQIW